MSNKLQKSALPLTSRILIAIFILLGLQACTTPLDPTDGELEWDGLEGTWVFTAYESEGNVSAFERSSAFDEEKKGIRFEKNGAMSERENAGWCGTPPITYMNYEGKIISKSESELVFEVAYWGGIKRMTYEVSELTSTTLKLRYIDSEFRERE
ncbi:MAG: hypothetical protein SFU91_04965 [Chloroherpetonaceae bacterium]|nr:hypothetical protein [Chloroherpetonaceae bacterium]